ncbi:TMEM165/GDT1 family protein [Sphingomonas sp. 2R-10]|uniref:TMEM165/GDT1 family protein n=1 Tax=Sphingomonas sp. 2R-10 TaxID=3045148 RepID=UPI000F77BD60|nr:TMEM165/GDT1 family protein [Sphingomonas sp. 2R-10]MDJ0278410.1 TMEM165/GDT1 family protein [Sphingomonas sp. 2R-10]
MDPLVPAFVAVLLAGVGDRPALLAAILADRHGRGATIAGIVAQAIGFGVAAAAGALVAPHLTPNARNLLLALALLSAGGSALVAARIRDRLDHWRLPGWLTGLLGMAILAFGDRGQFLVFALVARTPDPVAGAVGSTLAAGALSAAAATLGERGWLALPLRRVRPVVGGLLLIAGAVLGLGALRLL